MLTQENTLTIAAGAAVALIAVAASVHFLKPKTPAVAQVQKTPPPEPEFLVLKDGRKLAYHIYPPPEGPVKGTLIYFHGLPGSRLEVELLLHSVQDRRGYQVVGIDRPGFGQSDIDMACTPASFAQNEVPQLLEHLGVDQFSVAGTSGGGPYALACTRFFPKSRLRSAATIASIGPIHAMGGVWNAPGPLFSKLMSFMMTGLPRSFHVWVLRMQDGKIPKLQPSHFRGPDRALAEQDPKVIELFQNSMEESLVHIRKTADNVAANLIALGQPWGFDLSEIDHPYIHIYHGRSDINVPYQHAEYMAAHIRNAQLHLYDNVAHASIITKAEIVIENLAKDAQEPR
ncbi:Alpha/Beta hydrolase protein [Polychytrium aggregatum]|uniref:Alpha/Beta hydrolase protein n=1 Tax=Polychytrium aggregatum TaxID=110093 RepID=UPI0022FE3CFB|nr:Alpha/Beta hydrolase protein [Polychytrium aggregatum]KAI9197211.1 Alpha/Beta hydrolase protein [Polychytrium aggregatum]